MGVGGVFALFTFSAISSAVAITSRSGCATVVRRGHLLPLHGGPQANKGKNTNYSIACIPG